MRAIARTLIVFFSMFSGSVAAQEPLQPAPPPPLSHLLGDFFILSVMPSYGWVSPGAEGGTSLDARMFWPGRPIGSYTTQLGIDVGLANLEYQSAYVRGGADLRVRKSFHAFTPFVGLAGAVGIGGGPDRMLQVLTGIELGPINLALRSTWLEQPAVREGMNSDARWPAPTEPHFIDAEATVSKHVGPIIAGLTAGRRYGDLAYQRNWLFGTVTLPVREHLGVSFSSGWRPEQRERALPGGAFARISLRIDVSTRQPIVPVIESPVAEEFSLSATPRTVGYRLRIIASSATSVELKGDLTDWEARQFNRAADGVWELEVKAQPGVYRINIRIDQSDWRVPAGMIAVPDGFGATSGVLTLH